MNDSQIKHLADVPPMYQGTVRKAFEAEASPRAAIKAFCLACVGYQRAVITDCTSLACPLWPYRPFVKRAKKGKSPREASGETI